MVTTDVNTVTYNGNGSRTAFPFTFKIQDASEINLQLVYADGTVTDITSDFYVDTVNSTVHYPGYAPGSEPAEVDRPAPVQAGQKLTIWRDVPMTQENDLGDKWPFHEIEDSLDKLTMIAQQIYSYTNRKLDVALASMFQLAGIVTDSGKLQHITDQYNAIDANAAAAANSATASANSATNAANSDSSATATAAALTNFLATKETLTAPAVDPTLTISGAAADSKATGNAVTLLKNGAFAPELEVGNYAFNASTGWTKTSIKYRVRTKNSFHLKKGDVLSISDKTIGSFYVVSLADGASTYVPSGWMIQPYTAQDDQECVVTLKLQTENTSAVYTDPSDIGFTLNGVAYPNIQKLRDAYQQSKNLFNLFYNPWLNGYIGTSNGVFAEYKTGLTGIANRNYIPVESSTEYTFQWWGIQENASIYMMEYASDFSFIQTNSYSTGTIGGTTETHVYHVTTTATTKYVRFYILRASMAIERITPTYFQLEKGTVATDVVDGNILNPQMIDYDAGRKRLIDYGVVLDDFYLPDYYFANSYIQNKVARINTLLSGCANNGDAYIFITDEHWVYNQKKSPALLRYISEHCNILKLMDGGDNADNGSLDFCKKIELAWKKQGGEIYHTAGNHEFFNQTPQATICYYFDMFHDRPYHGNPDKLYYYFDNERQKIRYIVLAGYYESDTNNNMNGFYRDADQRAWLRDVALNVDSTWNVVVFTHDFWTINLQTNVINKLGQSTETLAILDAHNADATKGKILFIQQGHTHRDRITYTDGGIPLVMTTCDKNHISMINGYPDISPAVDRTSGTINEQAFDVVVIDKTLKKATFVRIGGKAQDGVNDNVGNLVEEREITWA